MKKFVFALAILLIANLSCKKISGLCACSPEPQPNLNLAIKSSTGDDLLNPTTTGSFSKSSIQLFYKDANGADKDINFNIRPPFNYSGDSKFEYYQLFSGEIVRLAGLGQTSFYIRLGNNAPYEINLSLDESKWVDKLFLNKTEAAKEPSVSKYTLSGSIFYIVR